MALSLILGLAAAIVFLNYVIPRKELWVGEKRISVAKNRADPDLRRTLKFRRKTAIINSIVVLACASFFIWTFAGGEDRAQAEHQTQKQMIRVQTSAAPYFVAPLTDSQLRDLAASKIAEIAVTLPDGTSLNVPFKYEFGGFLLPNGSQLRAQTTTPIIDKGSIWRVTANQQREWIGVAAIQKFKDDTIAELTANYGILLDDKQSFELEIPDKSPETLTRYGTTKLATASGDDYLLVNATLIWDQEFKLISAPEGGTVQTELPRVKQ